MVIDTQENAIETWLGQVVCNRFCLIGPLTFTTHCQAGALWGKWQIWEILG